jgi:hypothetical protein
VRKSGGSAGDSYTALSSTLIMMSTSEAVYGRVMSVYMVAQSIRPITVLPICAIADAISTPLTLVTAGSFTAAVVAAWPVSIPATAKPADRALRGLRVNKREAAE